MRRRPQQSRPQRIPVGVQPFGAADQKSVGLYRMKQGRHKIYRMSFLNNDGENGESVGGQIHRFAFAVPQLSACDLYFFG